MRILDISLFVFVVLLSIGAVDTALGAGTVSGAAQGALPNTNDVIGNIPSDTNEGFFWSGVTVLINSLSAFASILGVALNTGGYMKSLFPILPNALCAIVTAGIDLIYAIGIIQFVTGRSEKLMG